MLSANLSYNPYFQSAELIIDRGRIKTSDRLSAFISGKPISEWLDAYSRGYRKWEGFLPELISDLNEDSLALKFTGIIEDFETFSEALTRQNIQLESLGYNPSAWTLEHVPAFLPEIIIPEISRLLDSLLPVAPSQASMIALETVEEEAGLPTIEHVKSMYSGISSAIGKAIEYCRQMQPAKIRRWERAQQDLSAIITRGGL